MSEGAPQEHDVVDPDQATNAGDENSSSEIRRPYIGIDGSPREGTLEEIQDYLKGEQGR